MQETVLLVEDDDSIAEMLGQVFEKAGYRFRHCDSGEEAVTRVKTRPPSVVLLDIGLPGMDGLETCRQIRQISQIPIIMLTARDTEIDKVVGLEIGADDYVTKPFSPRELVARVKAVLRRSTETATGQKVVEVEGWIIDLDRHHVRFGDGLAVTPTAKEFDLLWYLAENAGLVLSRAQLLEAVWGYDYFGETRTVDVHIRQIRKKLEGIPIETVWGVGYRLGAS
jgi:DNA-binding response OmpR family regulator